MARNCSPISTEHCRVPSAEYLVCSTRCGSPAHPFTPSPVHILPDACSYSSRGVPSRKRSNPLYWGVSAMRRLAVIALLVVGVRLLSLGFCPSAVADDQDKAKAQKSAAIPKELAPK